MARLVYRCGLMRLAAIDELRGVAVVLMVMHHVVDSWTRAEERTGAFWEALRWLGGMPAPAFLFLAGVSATIVLAKERTKGLSRIARVQTGLRRGLYVLGIAFAFRVFAFVVGGNPIAHWDMIFRVDVLNCMGVALALVGALTALAPDRKTSIAIALGLAAVVSIAAPLVYGHAFPAPLHLVGNYVAGTGNLVLFPLFPWAAHVAFGAAFGEWFVPHAHSARSALTAARKALVVGAVFVVLFVLFQEAVERLYPPHDFWRSSPILALRRFGLNLGFLWLCAELVARLPERALARDPLQLLGRHSLLAYLLHLELAYGLIATPLKTRLPVVGALGGTLVLVGVCFGAAWWVERRERSVRATRQAVVGG